MAKKKMNYGKKDVLEPDDLDMKKAKIRITTMIDFPVYEALKFEAEKQGIGYQTLINNLLSHRMGIKKDSFEEMKELVESLMIRMKKIEKKQA